jgi:aspartyl-tRNA(Asn)/glutamyl-tRNA(Gln) amidotransferase subunit B
MLVRYLGTCDGDMEKGNLRADVNVSVRRPGDPLGTRCEIKNVNSMRFIQQAIAYEAHRQVEILEAGGVIEQETRLYDPGRGETRYMRSKEDAHDYRYFPDPDLLPLELDPDWVRRIQASLPELPDAKRERLQSQYGLSPYDAGVLVGDPVRAAFFEEAVGLLQESGGKDAKLVANWTLNDLSGRLGAEGIPFEDTPVKAADIAALVELIERQVISSKIAREVFEHMWAGEGSPKAIVEARGLVQVTDVLEIEQAIDEIMAANPDKVAAARDKPQAIGWFVGQVMKATGGKANPAAVNQILKGKLGG